MLIAAGSALAAEGGVEKGYIGCGLNRQKEGVYKVFDLISQGPAAMAGLKKDDLVTAVDGTPAAKISSGAVADGKIGSVVKIAVQRGDATEEISITRAPFLDIYFAPAMQGDKAAQTWLHWYLSGVASPESCAKALERLRSRADEGNSFAQRALGMMYERGRGVPKDHATAVDWYGKAAENGDATAQEKLGRIYYFGDGVRTNGATAAKWFRLAADQGDARAQNNLGLLYRKGEGVPRDFPISAKWFRKAANQRYADAEDSLGQMYEWGWGVPKSMEAAAGWYLKAARQGSISGAAHVGNCYLDGLGLVQDEHAAFAWFSYAALHGDTASEEIIGSLYENKRGVPLDYVQARRWYEKAARDGSHFAEWSIGNMYFFGTGQKRDLSEALKWYRMAAFGDPKNESYRTFMAMAMLGSFLDSDFTSKPDVPFLLETFHTPILVALIGTVLAFLLGCTTLLFFTFRAGEKAPGLVLSFFWLLFFFESQLAGSLACLAMGMTNIGFLLCVPALFCALPIIGGTLGPMRRRLWAPSQATWPWLLLYGCAASLAIFLVERGNEALYLRIFHVPIPPQPTVGMIQNSLAFSALFTWFCAGLLMPIAEEIIFRGYLFDALRRYLPISVVIFITSALFAAIHFQWPFLIPLFGLGVIQGWARHRTGSLRLPAALHALNNTIAVAFELWLSR